ncbi:aldolase/citrate lyase family protein, partial [Bradyrhizobium campsiandrae]|uniref:aldolase/citrate lyase family protein n=1 Tax=Bradyrhizobium campsiandrae TaxID=1729892 RepID=UPI001FCE9C7E
QKTANADTILLPMMETKTAVENMEAILDVEGIDGVYIGPSDLVRKGDQLEAHVDGARRAFGTAAVDARVEAALAAFLDDLLV